VRKDSYVGQFESHLRNTGIALPSLRRCVDHVPGLGFSCYAPSRVLGLIAILGGIQRSCSDTDPALAQFDDVEEFQHDPVALAAAIMINTMAVPDRGNGEIQSVAIGPVGACLHAENRFGEVFDVILRNEIPDTMRAGLPGRFQLITDENNGPMI
jgi:hypothetical protein